MTLTLIIAFLACIPGAILVGSYLRKNQEHYPIPPVYETKSEDEQEWLDEEEDELMDLNDELMEMDDPPHG